jgi:hypothetical protein
LIRSGLIAPRNLRNQNDNADQNEYGTRDLISCCTFTKAFGTQQKPYYNQNDATDLAYQHAFVILSARPQALASAKTLIRLCVPSQDAYSAA